MRARLMADFLRNAAAAPALTHLTLRELAILMRLAASPSTPLGTLEIAQALEMPKASVTRSVQRLERDGLAVNATHPVDKRLRLILLTEAGERAVDDLYAAPIQRAA
jgi:DNA-binding MarR family transcriptional regulator